MRIDLNIPKSWNEITGTQLIQLAKVFLRFREKPDFLTRCFFLFSGWRPLQRRQFIQDGTTFYWFKHGNDKFFLGVNLFTYLVQKLNWITTGIQLPKSMPPVTGYRHCNIKLFSVILEDYLNAENYYNAFIQTEDRKYLGKLFRVFYKRKKLAVRLWPVSRFQKYAVFMWFTGARNYLAVKYPYLFSGNSESGTVSPDEQILNLLSSLNNGDVTANDKIFKSHVHECFHELNLKIEYSPKNKS